MPLEIPPYIKNFFLFNRFENHALLRCSSSAARRRKLRLHLALSGAPCTASILKTMVALLIEFCSITMIAQKPKTSYAELICSSSAARRRKLRLHLALSGAPCTASILKTMVALLIEFCSMMMLSKMPQNILHGACPCRKYNFLDSQRILYHIICTFGIVWRKKEEVLNVTLL